MLQPGIILNNRYEIANKIGSGGMSDVYKARDTKLNRFVAVKVLKDELRYDNNFVSKFRVEAQSVASLSHTNIVNVYDVGMDENCYFIVMEYVQGITLKEYIAKKGRLSSKEAIELAIRIASGIEHAHDNHIIHRDIKPQNIIISREGAVKVTDFGIAKAASSATIPAGNVAGSVHYISPEQVRGGYSDQKSDIYSLGVTMYEMVTGQVPFQGENDISVAVRHVNEEIPNVRAIVPNIQPSLDAIIKKATQKKPEFRYRTMSDFLNDLHQAKFTPNSQFVQTDNITDSPTVMMTESDMHKMRNMSNEDEFATKINNNPNNNMYNSFDNNINDGLRQMEQQNYKNNTSVDPMSLSEENPDDDEEEKTPMDKMVVIGGVASAVLIVGFIAFFLFRSMGLFGGSDKVDVPNVIGELEAEAIEILEEYNLDYYIEYEPTDEKDPGYVLAQTPEFGDIVEEGDEVTLTVSIEADVVLIEVPDVEGMEYEQAQKLLEDEGFVVVREYDHDDNVDVNKVISQYPPSGSEIEEGETVTITISQGTEIIEVTVPNIEGVSETEARNTLQNRNLELGTITYEESTIVLEGRIIRQEINSGTTVEEGTKINVVISSGYTPEERNQSITWQLDDVLEKILDEEGNPTGNYEEAHLKVEVVSSSGGNSYPIDEQVNANSFPKSINVTLQEGEKIRVNTYKNGQLIDSKDYSY